MQIFSIPADELATHLYCDRAITDSSFSNWLLVEVNCSGLCLIHYRHI